MGQPEVRRRGFAGSVEGSRSKRSDPVRLSRTVRCGEVIHHPVGGVIASDRGVGEDLAASVPPDSDHRKPRLFAYANEAEFRISGGGERGQEIGVEEFVVGKDAQVGGVGLTGGIITAMLSLVKRMSSSS